MPSAIGFLPETSTSQQRSSISSSSPHSSSSSSVVRHFLPTPSKENRTKESKSKQQKNAKKSQFGGKMPTSPLKFKQRSRGAGVKFGGKKPHQVARRNERERKRVEALNNGYATLASKLSVSCRAFFDKKLTKAQTLKATILYIRHLEHILSSEKATDGTKNAAKIEEQFWRKCLAMAAVKDEQSTDDCDGDIIEQMEEADQKRHSADHFTDQTNADDHPNSFSFNDHPNCCFSSSDHLSSNDHPTSFSPDHPNSFSSSDHLTSFSSSDHLTSLSSSDQPTSHSFQCRDQSIPSRSHAHLSSPSSVSPSFCYSVDPYQPSFSFNSLPSSFFPYSSSVSFHSKNHNF